MNRRRPRRRASEIARLKPRRGLTSLILFGIALALIVVYQMSLSEDAAGVFQEVVGDPDQVMPPTVLDREAAQGAGGAEVAVGGASTEAATPLEPATGPPLEPTAGPPAAGNAQPNGGPAGAASDQDHVLGVENPGLGGTKPPAGAPAPLPTAPSSAGVRSEGAPASQSR